jgi:uncharacterized membrane protein YccC
MRESEPFLVRHADLIFALKTFAASMLALVIALAMDLPRPYWAMATVYITSQPLAGATSSKALFRVIGTLVGATMTVALVPNLINAPELLCLAIALWVGFCLYLSLLDGTPRSYLFMLAGYTVALIGFPSVSAPDAIFDTAVARLDLRQPGLDHRVPPQRRAGRGSSRRHLAFRCTPPQPGRSAA